MKPEYYKNEKNIDHELLSRETKVNEHRAHTVFIQKSWFTSEIVETDDEAVKLLSEKLKNSLNEIEDLKKAMEYLKREIEHIMTPKEKFLELVSEEKSNTLEKIRNRRQEKMDNYAIEILERYHNSLFFIPLKEGEAKRIVEHIKKEKGL